MKSYTVRPFRDIREEISKSKHSLKLSTFDKEDVCACALEWLSLLLCRFLSQKDTETSLGCHLAVHWSFSVFREGIISRDSEKTINCSTLPCYKRHLSDGQEPGWLFSYLLSGRLPAAEVTHPLILTSQKARLLYDFPFPFRPLRPISFSFVETGNGRRVVRVGRKVSARKR